MSNPQSTSALIIPHGFRVSLLTDLPGLFEVPAQEDARVSIHAGPPVPITCQRAGTHYSGVSTRGDIHLIPAATPSRWEVKGRDMFLTMSVAPSLLQRVAEGRGLDPRGIEVKNRFQIRDAHLENIAWALNEERERGYPCGQLYFDSLAVAARLICYHSSQAVAAPKPHNRLSDRRLTPLAAARRPPADELRGCAHKARNQWRNNE